MHYKNVHTYLVSNTEPTDEAVQEPQPCVMDQPTPQVTQRHVQLKLVATLDLVKTERDEREPLVTGLHFLPDGRIAAIDNKNKTCFIVNSDLQRQRPAFKFKSNPQDVTCYEENKLAVTLGYVL